MCASGLRTDHPEGFALLPASRLRPEAQAYGAAATKPRTFAYCRVSTDSQAENGQSLDVQWRQLEGWALQRGVGLDAVHVEAGVSGAVPFHEPPEGAKLWAGLRAGDTLVAAKLDRMFRSASDCLAVVEAFESRGVSLFLLDLNGGADDVSGNGIARLFLTIVWAFAEFERNRIGERIRATKQRQKASGEFSGAVPFGFMVDANRRLVPVKAQQAAIRRMHAFRRKGLSLRAISAELAKSGIKISHVSVGRVLGQQSP